MQLNITSLKGIEFQGETISVNIKTTSGEITVLDNHRPLLTALATGQAVVIKKDGGKLNFTINSGFLEVSQGNQASILIN